MTKINVEWMRPLFAELVWTGLFRSILIAMTFSVSGGFAFFAVSGFSSLQGATSTNAAQLDSTQLDSVTYQNLQEEKLRQEVLKLRYENLNRGKFWTALPTYAPFITALVAVVGVFITLWKQIAEASRQKELDRRQREAERKQRAIEGKQRIDEQFSAIAASLGAESEAIQASGAVSIATFSKPRYEEYYAQAFMLVLANLKISHSSAVTSLLVNSFEKIARNYLPLREGDLDLSYLTLTGVNLSGLDLTGADIAHTNLQRADLTHAVLKKVRGYGVRGEKARFSRANLQAARLHAAQFADGQFHDATLIDVKMRAADLQRAQFQRSELQGAHFDRANLKDAKFHQANLNEAYFKEATGLTLTTLRSIIKAKNWEKAYFDDGVRDKLYELAEDAVS